MKSIKNKLFLTFSIIIVTFSIIILVLSFYYFNNKIKSITAKNQSILTDYDKSIKELEEKFKYVVETYKEEHLKFEQNIKKNLKNIGIKDIKEIKINENITLKKYINLNGFLSGINNSFPGSGYIDFHNNDLVILSSKGILAFKPNGIQDNETWEQIKFKQIKNNLDQFIKIDQFKKFNAVSFKDLTIINDKIFITYTEEVEENCWNTALIYSKINYNNIEFEKIFSSDSCISLENNPDNELELLQSGGRVTSIDNDHILLSIGEYRNRSLAQDDMSDNGKLIKININNFKNEIISKGHRNPQGLYYDKVRQIILETEHGPLGGDEINLIDLKNFKTGLNFGWPISSYGGHYASGPKGEKLSKKYPLYKSHMDYGFVEPLHYFDSSIGISEITKIKDNHYVVSSLKANSIYFFKLNSKNNIIDMNQVNLGERIRDLIYKKNKLYLFLENTASLGIIKVN